MAIRGRAGTVSKNSASVICETLFTQDPLSLLQHIIALTARCTVEKGIMLCFDPLDQNTNIGITKIFMIILFFK